MCLPTKLSVDRQRVRKVMEASGHCVGAVVGSARKMESPRTVCVDPPVTLCLHVNVESCAPRAIYVVIIGKPCPAAS